MLAFIRIFFVILGDLIVSYGWKLLKGLGFGIITYTGVSVFLNTAQSLVFSHIYTLPSEWLGLLYLLKVDVCLKIFFSAYIARAILWGMNKDTGSKSNISLTGK